MSDTRGAECLSGDALRETALAAITRHIKLEGRLQIAQLAGDREGAAELEPLVEAAEQDRQAALEAYRAYLRGTGLAAEAEGSG